jgi:DNA invertase Pin-like site-specific DNA recombinase
MIIGYARTSSVEQVAGLEGQVRQLIEIGSDKLFTEQVSSVSLRDQLEAALNFVREGDTLVVTRLDRLARSTTDLLSIVSQLEAKQVALRILDFGGQAVDTKSPSGKLIITMFGALAQFEREIMLTRQREGIEKAKQLGRYKGRAPTARRQAGEVRRLAKDGVRAAAIAEQLSISRASVYRILAEAA